MARAKLGMSLHSSTMMVPYAAGCSAGCGSRSIWLNSVSAASES
jgi:hypothetical protein